MKAPGSRFKHRIQDSPFGKLAIVWREDAEGPMVHRVFLPAEGAMAPVNSAFPESRPGRHPAISELASALESFLRGERVEFSLDRIALDICSAFQRRVLLAESRIPRGWVSTYGAIAAHLGVPKAARAVGRALARNPFPIIIPCHRAIGSGGRLGGYQGGLPMKRALLEYEGVFVSKDGKVDRPRFFYEDHGDGE